MVSHCIIGCVRTHSSGGREKEEEEEEVSYSPDLETLISYFPSHPRLRRPRFLNELESWLALFFENPRGVENRCEVR